MSNSPFKNHKFLQSQALHNGLFQKLHSAYICMKKLQKKSSSAYLSFGHLIKKVIGFIFTISVKSLESNRYFFSMWQMNDLHHGLSVMKDKPVFLPGTPRPRFTSACICREYQMHCSSARSLSTLRYQEACLICFYYKCRRSGGHQPGKEVR